MPSELAHLSTPSSIQGRPTVYFDHEIVVLLRLFMGFSKKAGNSLRCH
jgi:hypothetical protein